MTTALVTGISGQDGSYLAEQLLSQGVRVVGVHRRLSAENFWRIEHVLDRVDLRYADLHDLGSLYDLVEEYRPDEIYNLAAQSFVPTSWSQPILTAEATGLGPIRLLEAVRRVHPKARVYQASSSEMFGNSLDGDGSLNERSRFAPASPYACAKLYAHHMVANYRKAYGLFVVSGILFNHESPRRGLEFVTRKVANGVAKVHLGLTESLTLGALSPRRDWGFAGDYTRAMQAMLRASSPQDYVVATGVDHSVEDLVRIAFAVVDRDWRDHVEHSESLMRKNEVVRLRGDASRARDELGWTPEVDFSGLVRRMVEAELERLG
ncbi:MAG: GDP-mannose 4,6-dehydratase [Proteobacteria bacterium]|nr:GDP-mannose 4,6-dehydratase [Pseudomonadota bacterium]